MPRRSPALPTLSASARDRVRLSTNPGNNHEYTLGHTDVLMPSKAVEHGSVLACPRPAWPVHRGLSSRAGSAGQRHPLKRRGHRESPVRPNIGQHLERSARQVIHRLMLIELMMRNLSYPKLPQLR
jgi:hypothetical protein